MRSPRLLLVNPRTGPSFWGLEYAVGMGGARYSNAPLPLLTVGALTPDSWDVRLCDENVEPVDLDAPCDLVGITAMNVQAQRAFELADAFRRRGRRVAMGGPFATVQPERCAARVDALFVGDAERTWPRFCRDFERGTPERLYREPDPVELAESPVPRYDLLRAADYFALPIQTTRGCPYTCEFCDVIVLQGRRVRTKPVEQVLAELEAARRAGAREIFFTDDNLIGNPRYTRELLRALVARRAETGYRPQLLTQASVNLAEQGEILDLMVRAGFTRVFLGIETPRRSSLQGSGKRQNLRGDLVERIGRIQHAGLMIWAGMVVGFDQDDGDVFREQAEFLDAAGIAVAMLGMLNAPVATPLHARLAREGRLHSGESWDDNCAWTNIIPARMTREELFRGFGELVQEVYERDRYVGRVLRGVERTGPAVRGSNAARRPRGHELVQLARALRTFGLSRDAAQRHHFLSGLLQVGRRRPDRWAEGMIHLGMWRHYALYVPQLVSALEASVAREAGAEPARVAAAT